MFKTALRFLLLRFLPRRLFPILTAIEVVRLVQRLRGSRSDGRSPRRIVTSGDPRSRQARSVSPDDQGN